MSLKKHFSLPHLLLSLVVLIFSTGTALEYTDGGYNDLTIAIRSDVPSKDCQTILANLERVLIKASESLFDILGVYWRSIGIILPGHWGEHCVANPVPSLGEKPDFFVGPPHPLFQDSVWTQQSRPCGQPGDFVQIGYRALTHDSEISRSLVREWAKYRYGVFDELGYHRDPIYPSCYHSDLSEKVQVNGCSDKPIAERGKCSSGRPLNVSLLVNPEAHTSLLFTDSHRVHRFCDISSHDRFAPTKQNNLCQRRSVMQVIEEHADFTNNTMRFSDSVNSMPTIVYKRETLTRYVIVIEDSKDMLMRESWSYLRMAIRKWVVAQLQGRVEVGLVSANETSATLLQSLTPLHKSEARDYLASNVPYTPGDSRAACLHCGIRRAFEVLQERAQEYGDANSVIVLIAPGTRDHTPDLKELVLKLKGAKMKIATITYPAQVRPKSLDWLAEATDGTSFTVMEMKWNMQFSHISTYFKLTNVFRSIQKTFYQGDISDLPIEIHRKELVDNGQKSVVGSFVLDPWLGEPAKFSIFTHNSETPFIQKITLVSPSHKVYSNRSDALLSLKLLTVPANINETGTWTYTIERYNAATQPHYVQVLATPRSSNAPIVTANLYTSQTPDYLILYTQVKRGDFPVLGAKVEVFVSKQGVNGSIHQERFELIDTGSGDPDLMKGDGIYSRYFSAHLGGAGIYTFEVVVTDNGNTAYTWQQGHRFDDTVITSVSCCGSYMPVQSVEPLSPFQRILPPLTLELSPSEHTMGRVADLRVDVIPSDLKARLVWTSPDMGGKPVKKYELRFAHGISNIVDNFDSARIWTFGSPFSLAPGSETTFSLNFTKNPSLLDQTLYFALRGFSELGEYAEPGPVSNWVRVNVPSPPPPPPVTTPTPTFPPIWPSEEESVVPNLAEGFELNLEIILPVVVGIIILIIAISLYCYICLRRRTKKDSKSKHPEKPLNVSIVPTENGNSVNNVSSPIISPTNNSSYDINSTMTNLPQYEIRVEEDTQKRYSVTNYDGIQQNGGNLSVLGTYGNGTLTVLNEYDTRSENLSNIPPEKPMSPYQSWSASQLLKEHERRHSPYGQPEDYSQYYAPPIPPLPQYQQQDIYGMNTHLPPPNQFMTYQPNPNLNPIMYNPSLQGSLTSVNSSERKRRNVTMV